MQSTRQHLTALGGTAAWIAFAGVLLMVAFHILTLLLPPQSPPWAVVRMATSVSWAAAQFGLCGALIGVSAKVHGQAPVASLAVGLTALGAGSVLVCATLGEAAHWLQVALAVASGEPPLQLVTLGALIVVGGLTIFAAALMLASGRFRPSVGVAGMVSGAGMALMVLGSLPLPERPAADSVIALGALFLFGAIAGPAFSLGLATSMSPARSRVPAQQQATNPWGA